MIRAEVQTDDDQFCATFDATPFFERATFEQLAALRDSGWGGDEPADAVALFMLERDDAVADLFRYLALDPVTDDGFPVGFECYVSESDVARWVQRNRPGWSERLWPGGVRPDVTPLSRTSLSWLTRLFRPSGAGCMLSLR
jgi:hypothetical protein